MEKEEFIKISEKVADGVADETDINIFNAYFNQYQIDYPEWDSVAVKEKENIIDELRLRIQQQIQPVPASKKRPLWPLFSIAASLIAVLSIGLVYWRDYSNNQTDFYANVISPAKNTATLTLANGQKIILAGNLKGELAKESGVVISKGIEGQIIYRSSSAEHLHLKNQWNTLTTARGETIKVILADGTRIWLNAASSLRYLSSPDKQGPRRVELRGEAYFEVAKDKIHPFIVKSREQEVEVLGTEFNINSYQNEASVKTTLLSGLVKVNGKMFLKPNQQAIVNSSGIGKIIDVNAENFTDWKDGVFYFDKENIRSVMRKISRWYNVEIEYDGFFDDTKMFSGTISSSRNLSEVLKVLQDSEGIHFRIKGNKVIVFK